MERVDVQQLRERIKARALVGIPGGFTEGVAECLPTDGDEWGYVLSEGEFAALLARLDALEEVAEAAEQFLAGWAPDRWDMDHDAQVLIAKLARLREGKA